MWEKKDNSKISKIDILGKMEVFKLLSRCLRIGLGPGGSITAKTAFVGRPGRPREAGNQTVR